MEDAGVGWIAAIMIGGLAGWLAEQFMKSNMGLIMNIILGIVGAIVANAMLGLFGIALGGWMGYLIAGFIGACILIWLGRADQAIARNFCRCRFHARGRHARVAALHHGPRDL
ncbi:MAG: GlsB/YeaQ/YmgE family stress response membrane protein [Brucellaceae bacterium]|nr:GlsB/YeaQ/YmgE family stress response membrane protein [Brucellaceae bacterium]